MPFGQVVKEKARTANTYAEANSKEVDEYFEKRKEYEFGDSQEFRLLVVGDNNNDCAKLTASAVFWLICTIHFLLMYELFY